MFSSCRVLLVRALESQNGRPTFSSTTVRNMFSPNKNRGGGGLKNNNGNIGKKVKNEQTNTNSDKTEAVEAAKKDGAVPAEAETLFEVYETVSLRRVVSPMLFTFGFTGAAFGAAAIWQYETMREKAQGMWTQQRRDLHRKFGAWRNDLNILWNSLSDADKLFIPICAANVAVFIAWRFTRLHPVMIQWFMANPVSIPQSLPLLLSSFSHNAFWHLGLNMFCLYSFIQPAVNYLGREQCLALYLSSGVIAAFGSLLYKVIINRAGYSLGASGAIMCIIGTYGSLNPDAMLQIVFLPQFQFTADSAIKAFLTLDGIGMLMRWRFFDHAAHFFGMTFGVWWVHYGHKLIWEKREPLMTAWHNYRQKRDE